MNRIKFTSLLLLLILQAGVAQVLKKEDTEQLKFRHIGPVGNRVTCAIGIPGNDLVYFAGAASGAAFGFLEAMTYGLNGIQHSLGDWWQIMLLRGGSTSLHVLCTGLTGVGWWYWTVARRSGVGAGLFGLAVLFHASWNGAFTLLESRILGLDTLSDRALEIVAYVIVGVVSSAFIVAIPVVARRLRDPAPPSAAGTPLAAIAPWLG